MPRFEIYAGLGGGFGGASLQCIEQCDSLEEAKQYAYELAIEKYESYGDIHGLQTYDQAIEEAKIEVSQEEDFNEDLEEWQEAILEYANEIYNDWLERWIDYYVKEIKEEVE